MKFKLLFDLQQPQIRYKWMVFSRIIAAIFGAYWLTSLITISLSLLLTYLGIIITEAILTATMLSFLIYSIIVIFIFSCKSLKIMWLWLIGLVAIANLLILIFKV